MTDHKALFDRLDQEIMRCIPAARYAEAHTEELIESAYQNCVRKVYTTSADHLGIACPCLIMHRVIGGSKRGRILKAIPAGKNYCEIGYDSCDRPLYFKHINLYGTEQTAFFFDLDGDTWVMGMELRGKDELYRRVERSRIRRISRDAQGRILLYAETDAPYIGKEKGWSAFAHTLVHMYEYPDDPEKPIVCRHYYYGVNMSASGRTADPDGWHFSELLYEITPDLKTITEYCLRANGEKVFSRQLVSGKKKSAKPEVAADCARKFAEWLDAELGQDISASGGIYFDLFAPTEDGFGIYFCRTCSFSLDDEDWACDAEYTSAQMFMVQTNGLMEREDAIAAIVKLVNGYMENGAHRDLLLGCDGIGTAFADGDITYIYSREQ